MKTIKNVYLCGLGAIGSTYASRIIDYAPDSLRVISDDNRIERYKKEGVKVNGKTYTFQYIRPGDSGPPADLILIAVKQHHLLQAILDIRQFVDKDTVILSLLNGISSEEIVGGEFGMEKMLYSFVVGTDAVRESTHTVYSNMGKIVFGDKTNLSCSENVTAVVNFFDKVHISYSIPENMLRELWWKFMLNVGINQTSAVLRASYGVFQNIREARELMISASKEVVDISRKAGINLTREDIDEMVRIVSTLSPEGKTSMFQDIEAGRKTEVEIFSGTVIQLGHQYGIATPVNEILFKMITTLEKMQKS